MNRPLLRNGLLSAGVLCVACFLNFKLNSNDYARQEMGGYAGILLSMVFVFMGMNQYRDQANGGNISYAQALWAGTLIAIFPAIAFGIFNVIHVKYMDPGFMEKYYNYSLQQMKTQLPPAEYQLKAQEFEKQMAMFTNVSFQFALMTATALVIGIASAAGSAIILQKKPKNS